MADHVRKQLRDAIKIALEQIPDLTVFTNRVKDVSDLPYAVIITEDESSERVDKDDDLQRTIDVLIVVAIEGTADDPMDDDLDALAVLVEDKMNSLFGLLDEMTLTATAMDNRPDEDGDQWYGFLVMNYQALVTTPEGDPTTTV